MTITLKEIPPKKWRIDVAGTLPNGKKFRKRTIQTLSSQTAAQRWGEAIWKEKLAGAILGATPTVEAYAMTWLADREKRGLSSAKTNGYQLAHLLPALGSYQLKHLTRHHIAAAVAEMEEAPRLRGKGTVSPRTVLHSYSTLRTMLEDAIAAGYLLSNPATLRARRQEIPVKQDKVVGWRRTAIYTTDELRALISDPRINAAARIAYALEGLAGLRYGEASALRWSSWSEDAPLGRLDIFEAYDSNNNRLKSTKTDTRRAVPVHATLADLLADWQATGWQAHYGRPPKPSDLIIPVKDGRVFRHRHKLDGHKAHVSVLAMLEMRHRRQHDLRRTFITLCRLGAGGPVELLKWITHGPPRSAMMDEYTSPPWASLCRFVENVELSL